MISGLLNGLASLLGPLIDGLPAFAPPTLSGGAQMGTYLRIVDYFVPIAGPISFSLGMLAALPAFLALKFTLMVFSASTGGGVK